MSRITKFGCFAHSHGNLYTIEDVRSVNAMQVKQSKGAPSVWHCKAETASKTYTAMELNEAWKGVSKK